MLWLNKINVWLMTLDNNIKCLNSVYEEITLSRDTLMYYQIVGSIKTGCSLIGIEEPKYIVFAEKQNGLTVEAYMRDFDYDFMTYRMQIIGLDNYLKDQAQCNSTEDFKVEFVLR